MRGTEPRGHLYDSVPAQTLTALSFNVISLFAGGLISLCTPRFQVAPWILSLFPPILTIRGGIGGIFSGNLATLLHLGLIRPQTRGNTALYNQLISAVFVITLLDTVAMGILAFALNIVFGRATLNHLFIFVIVPPVACTIAMALTVPLTLLIAVATFRRGLDPDIIVYPILASINDIIVTAAFVTVIFLVIYGGPFLFLLWSIFILILAFSGLLVWRNREVRFFLQTIREGTTLVIMSSLLGSVNGIFLSRMERGLIRYPGVVVLYPALTNALGNIGSIVGSTTTTSLALGYVRNLKEEVQGIMGRVSQVEMVAFLMHLVFGVITYLLMKPTAPEANLLPLVVIAAFSNLSSFLPISLFALLVAFLSFRRGLNPDNVVIPIITSTSDTVATLALLPAIAIMNLLGFG